METGKQEEMDVGGKCADSMNENKKMITTPKSLSESNIFSIINRYDTYISLANNKASFLLGASSVIIIALISGHKAILSTSEIACISWFNNLVLLLIGLCLFTVLFCSILVALPITKAGNKHGAYTSFIAYSSVSEMDSCTYESKLSSSDYDFWHDLVLQSHIMAKITASKFTCLSVAAWASFGAVTLSVILAGFVIL